MRSVTQFVSLRRAESAFRGAGNDIPGQGVSSTQVGVRLAIFTFVPSLLFSFQVLPLYTPIHKCQA